MTQTQVAELAGDDSGAGLNGLSDRGTGETVPFLEGAGDRDGSEERFVGFGIRVTFGDDFRNPAYKDDKRISHFDLSSPSSLSLT